MCKENWESVKEIGRAQRKRKSYEKKKWISRKENGKCVKESGKWAKKMGKEKRA